METLNTTKKKNKKLTPYNVKKELPSMIELFSIESCSGHEDYVRIYIVEKLNSLAIDLDIVFEIDDYGNVLITKGIPEDKGFYPCLMSHLDTVHSFTKDYEIIIKKAADNKTRLQGKCAAKKKEFTTNIFGKEANLNNYEYSSDAGIGGDDFNGIWLCLKLLTELPILKVVFTVEEETGGFGAQALDLKFFDDVGYIIEGDRKGNSDLITDIFGSICSEEFIRTIKPIMNKYKYFEEDGMFTDVDVLRTRGLEISCINMSVGYYNPHSDAEYVIVEDLLKATQFAKECIILLGYKKYEFKLPAYKQSRYSYRHNEWDYYDNFYEHDDFDDFTYKSIKPTCKCSYGLTDVTCEEHNPTLKKYSGIICFCGEELQQKELTYYCPYCNKHFIYEL